MSAFKKPGTGLAEKYIDVIRSLVARIIHLLKPPVSAIASDAKDHLACALARLAIVDVADARDDFAIESKLLRINPRDDAIHRHQVIVAAPALFAFDK